MRSNYNHRLQGNQQNASQNEYQQFQMNPIHNNGLNLSFNSNHKRQSYSLTQMGRNEQIEENSLF